ncbi:MAG TPA: VOC family protein [Candidatus Acidoferrum sp.]|jgi:catechol 2,3-dioxygenase-like lactoylglutathione lyase family enzyme|nr:VOC family protein [Candidatus Acidoferrum sp.]
MWGRKNFYFGDNISVGVRDLDGAIAWYEEKLGLKLTPLKSEDFDAFLAFGKKDEIGLALCLIPPGQTTANVEGHPILFSKTIEAAYEDFSSKGINVEPIQSDSGGNQFFRFRDLEQNVIEVCREP